MIEAGRLQHRTVVIFQRIVGRQHTGKRRGKGHEHNDQGPHGAKRSRQNKTSSAAQRWSQHRLHPELFSRISLALDLLVTDPRIEPGIEQID